MIKGLIDVQAELKAPKNQYNKFGGFSYRSAEDILEAVKPLLHKYQLQLSCSEQVKKLGDRIYIICTATITDGNETLSVDGIAREPFAKKGMDDSQLTGSTSSYAKKYALNDLFLIDDNKDADAQKPEEPKEEAPKKKRPTKQKAAPAVDLQPIRSIFKEFCRASGRSQEEAMREICQAVGAKDMQSMTAAQVAKAVAAMRPIINAAAKEQAQDLAPEDYQF